MRMLGFAASLRLLKKYGVPFAESAVVHDMRTAVKAAERFGFPVVLKLLSPEVVHKTEKGLVRTGVHDAREVERAYGEIMRRKGRVRMEGVLVQKQLSGTEIIIGGKRDAQFGPLVLFGLGGIFTEVLKDFSIRITPVTQREALRMMREVRGHAVLRGARGQKPANEHKIADVILRTARLMQKEKVAELDLNPCFAGARCVAADVRILVE